MSATLPEGSCDCHAHVFGPFEQFPLATERTYTPPSAPRADYMAMLDAAGLARGVLVHPTANGWDNSAMLDAIAAAPERLRGVAVVPLDTSENELNKLHDQGVRGVRFTETAQQVNAPSPPGRLSLQDLYAFAPKLRELGWHAQIWANASILADHLGGLTALGLPVVLDHLGFFDVSRGVEDTAFQSLLRFVAEGPGWVKLTMFRNSKEADYSDVRPFHEALIGANPERLVWGSDWPFLGMTGERRPTTEGLLGKLMEWTPEPVLPRILVDNPARLYGF
jgi:predicted TIM-barrel fold metal-dependent hydrolase